MYRKMLEHNRSLVCSPIKNHINYIYNLFYAEMRSYTFLKDPTELTPINAVSID